MSTSAPPTLVTDETFPVWQDIVNNWRAIDALWIRDRLVHVFDDSNERNTVLGGAARQGMVTYLKATGTIDPALEPAGLYVRTASAWESVRYPNLTVTSTSTTVSLVRQGAGTGITLKSDGGVDIASATISGALAASTLFVGVGTTGTTLNNTGVSLKVGTKTVKLATNATQLTVDSPVLVTGDIESTATLRGLGAVLTGTLTVPTATMSGTVTAGLLVSGVAEVATASSLAVFRHTTSPTNRLSFSSTGAAVLTGSTVVVNGATTLASPVVAQGTVEMQGIATIHPAGTTAAPVAGVIALSRAPTASDLYPNGTIWFQI